MVQLAFLLLLPSTSRTPLDFGLDAIREACGARAADVRIVTNPKLPKEGFTIATSGKKVTISGGDRTGAMYGAFEFAERIHQQGPSAWDTKLSQKPYLADRGVNLFLTLPWDYKKNDTDYDIAALTDPNRWWFANEDYWKTLLDLMAKSRLNWLDIHGGWDISVTNAPNMYAYFVTSPSFPLVGVPEEVKAKDLKQLNHVIDMAHERGIRVSLMCYEANLKVPQNPNPPYEASEANIYKYTKEVVEQMIRKTPGLDAIGYRIGESGHGESFFKCYGEAIKASGRDIPIVTRSWITRKQKVLPLARASKDFTVEIKYNGEQWGAPYMVAGGRMANWGSYSFEDYLSDSNVIPSERRGGSSARSFDFSPTGGRSSAQDDKVARMWLGNPVAEPNPKVQNPKSKVTRWPSEPYKIVWQVRANGTHRIFPFYNPEWVRRSIKAMKIGTASGYTIEGEDAYYPKAPDYYLADLKDKYCDWIHQRDEMYWTTWGRLGYDPNTSDRVFDARAKSLLGSDSDHLVQAWKSASTALSWNFMAYSLGPDHRDNAPELEWGGDSSSYIQGSGLDPHVFLPINEEFANRATGGIDGRFSLWDHAVGMDIDSGNRTQVAESFLKTENPRTREIAHFVLMQSARSDYYVNRFKSAHELANMEATFGKDYRDSNVDMFEDAAAAHGYLATNSYLRPFTEKLRMHTNTFAWAQEQPKVDAERSRLEALPAVPKELRFWAANMNGLAYMRGENAKLSWKEESGDIVCRLENVRPARAWLLVKPLPSSTFFHKIPMARNGQNFVARFKRERWGYLIAAEAVSRDNEATRFPDVQKETPFIVVPSKPGPTPQIYAADEAMTFLDPAVITPQKYGAILIGTRANNFFNRFDRATKRKLLDPVSRGLKLVILQEDFNKDKLDFLPHALRFEGAGQNIFDPGGQLGLGKVGIDGIMYQRFLPSGGWEIFGNGGLARMRLGKGEVWVTSARLMQSLQYPSAAKNFVRLLGLGGKVKPTIIVDSCSEGAVFTSSCHMDLMNSHDISFLTLGEVIANEQGMNSFEPIPGPTMNDDVLGGKGQAMVNKFLRDRVIAMSKQPTAPNVEAFEKLRRARKKELMRSLGLDPMPAKTPLNARITGTIQGKGYHIEKLVFESRPNWYVTGHVYVPEGGNAHDVAGAARPSHGFPDLANGQRFPIIMNVNGHWAHKKDEDRIQLRCQFQALQGYIAIAIDSPGWSFEGNSLIERRPEGDHNDFDLVEGGSNTTGYYVWDAIRALDYMATRPDTDMSRIGITGASGGGLATLYAFAADDRYKAAVPVVYMASLELAPDNGCLCNHVPGTCLIGDRSDVIGIQAPKPVYLMGALNDGEFPPAATRLTQKKMAETWKLFGKDSDTYVQIFAGGHDYNQKMREASIGFFNHYVRDIPLSSGGEGLRSRGEGAPPPVSQPALTAIDPGSRQLLAADPPIPNERTMRELSLEYLVNAPQEISAAQAIAANGGRPAMMPANYVEKGDAVTFESEPGLVTPGILVRGTGPIKAVRIHLSDSGKAAALESQVRPSGVFDLYIDALGTGELSGIEMRFPIYAGRSVAFTAGWQAVRAAEAMRKYSKHIDLIGDGPMSSQAVMWAGLLDPSFAHITGDHCLESWADVFKPGIDPIAIQPRANLCGSLANLRKKVKNATWFFPISK